MLVQIREEELTKLKKKVTNLRQQVRTFNKSQVAEKEKAEFSDTDKLIMLESVLFQLCGTDALEPMVRKILQNFNDNAFWRKHRHENIEEILIYLAKIGMN